MKKKLIWLGHFSLFMLPFILATVGFYDLMEGNVLNAMYSAMRLYLGEMDCDPSKVNFLLEIARWTAPLMSAAAILTILSQFLVGIRIWFRVRKADTVVIHGDSPRVSALAESLGKRAVVAETRSAQWARTHVLLFREDKSMLSYLDEHRKTLCAQGRKVYLCSEELARGNFKNRDLTLCSFPENCARQYWLDHPLTVARKKQQIVIIGTGNYGSALLSQALLTNVIAVDSCIVYHIFGDSTRFQGLHTQLSAFLEVNEEAPKQDGICFHSEPWWANSDILTQADRIILADDREETNLMVLSEIKRFYPIGMIHVKVSDASLLEDLWDGVAAFGTAASLCSAENVLNEARMRDAKRIHSTYFSTYQCKKDCAAKNCIDCEAFAENWSSLSNFTRYSNAAQADHIPVKIQILLGDDFRSIAHPGMEARKRFDLLTSGEKSNLFELEHIRWCRYHYLNNWQYAPIRDNAKRQHPLLVPYSQLEKKEEEKDADPWLSAFALFDQSLSQGGNCDG